MGEANESMIDIRSMTFTRGDRVIFDDISLTIPKGKIVAIMGPSGTGKTTLLKLMSAQLTPDRGEVLFQGHALHQLSTKALFQARKKMGLLFQSGGLFTNLSVFDNVAFPLRENTTLSATMIRDLVLMKLEMVGLRGAAQLMPAELSGGMSHRVAMARSLAMDPELMMYDEPFTGQDPITMGVLVKLIRELNDALGLTSIVVSHDVEEAASIADYIYVLFDGKVIGEGLPSNVMKDPNPAIQQFMNGLPDGSVPYNYPAQAFQEELEL